MVIQCDTKLRDLLGCESISAVGVGEVLARHHLFKRS
jgi:upstream activation factor subunit UAF30